MVCHSIPKNEQKLTQAIEAEDDGEDDGDDDEPGFPAYIDGKSYRTNPQI